MPHTWCMPVCQCTVKSGGVCLRTYWSKLASQTSVFGEALNSVEALPQQVMRRAIKEDS